MPSILISDAAQNLREMPNLVPCTDPLMGLPQIRVERVPQGPEMLGFGVALTDASCFLLSQMPAAQRQALLTDIFSPAGLNLSVARICVGASDYATTCYNYAPHPGDIALERFSIEHDRRYILPVLREIRAINPDLFLFSSTWSPPGWMKTSGSMFGGWLRADCLEVYARYYARFLEEYAREGVTIQALTLQNEVETDQAGRMPASLLHPDFETALARDELGPLLHQRGLETKIWILDHNYNLWQRASRMLDDPGLKRAVNGVAFHYYDGTADMLSLLHQAHPEIELHWTEGGPDLGPTYATDAARWGQVFTEALQHGCRSITGWNLLLDEHGQPNLGPFSCAGLVTRHSVTGDLSYSGQYRAFAHLSRFIRRGARRIVCEGPLNGAYHHAAPAEPWRLYPVAFENPDGEVVIVLTNPGARKEIQLAVCGSVMRVALPAGAIATIRLGD